MTKISRLLAGASLLGAITAGMPASAAIVDFNFSTVTKLGRLASGRIVYDDARAPDFAGTDNAGYYGTSFTTDYTGSPFVDKNGFTSILDRTAGFGDSIIITARTFTPAFTGFRISFSDISGLAITDASLPSFAELMSFPIKTFAFENVSGEPVDSGLLIITSNLAAASAVPEPGTWTMMIAGFGIASAALRTRRRKITTRVALA